MRVSSKTHHFPSLSWKLERNTLYFSPLYCKAKINQEKERPESSFPFTFLAHKQKARK